MSSIVLAAAFVAGEILALVGIWLRLRAHLQRELVHDRLVADILEGLPPGTSLYDQRADGSSLVLTVAPANDDQGAPDG